MTHVESLPAPDRDERALRTAERIAEDEARERARLDEIKTALAVRVRRDLAFRARWPHLKWSEQRLHERAVAELVDSGLIRVVLSPAVHGLAVEHDGYVPSATVLERVWVAGSSEVPSGWKPLLGMRAGLPVVLVVNPAEVRAVALSDGRWSFPGAEGFRNWRERVEREMAASAEA